MDRENKNEYNEMCRKEKITKPHKELDVRDEKTKLHTENGQQNGEKTEQ